MGKDFETNFIFQRKNSPFQLEVKLSFSKHSILGLRGSMGAGKSTFFHCLSGLLRPQRGHFIWQGQTMMDSAKKLYLSPQQRPIAYLFQEDRIFRHLSVRANLLYAARARLKKKEGLLPFGNVKKFFFYIPKMITKGSGLPPDPYYEEILHLLDLHPLLAKKSHELSGGESRRLALGRCLLSSFSLLLLDEPFRSLSPKASHALIDYLKKRSDLSIIFSSHQDELIDVFAKEVIEMDDGKIIKK